MPLYEYECLRCSHRFEELVFGEAQPSCPSCQTDQVEKQLSSFAVGRASSRAPAAACGPVCGPAACGPAPGACGPCGPGSCD